MATKKAKATKAPEGDSEIAIDADELEKLVQNGEETGGSGGDELIGDEPPSEEPIGDEPASEELIGDEPAGEELIGDEPGDEANRRRARSRGTRRRARRIRRVHSRLDSTEGRGQH